MEPKFQRRIEDFRCENCGSHITGDGFTNHCPNCLWSKHVDVNPGDRAEPCHGMMEPVGIQSKADGYRILFHCTRCGVERWNKAADDDEFEVILQIAKQQSEQ